MIIRQIEVQYQRLAGYISRLRAFLSLRFTSDVTIVLLKLRNLKCYTKDHKKKTYLRSFTSVK